MFPNCDIILAMKNNKWLKLILILIIIGAFIGGIIYFKSRNITNHSYNTPSITIESQNYGSEFLVSEPFTVKWSTSNIPKNHKLSIGLSPAGGFQGVPPITLLSNSTINDGEETFSLLSLGIPADTYFVFMKDNDLPNGATNIWSDEFKIIDTSNKNSIMNNNQTDCLPTTKPWVKVLSPNGGEIYQAGESVDVKWKSCNLNTSVYITLSGFPYPNNIQFGLGSWVHSIDNIETVIMPATVKNGNYTINIGTSPENSPSVSDFSDRPFTIKQSSQVQTQLYKNTELGFSFVSPYGAIKFDTFNTPEGIKEASFISKGTKGESFRGFILNYPDPIFYFAGITKNYSAERETDCGEVGSVKGYEYGVSLYGEKINKEGVPYVYGNVTTSEMIGPHQIAYFKLNKGQFPVLGFCAIKMNESDFKSVIDTVKIEK